MPSMIPLVASVGELEPAIRYAQLHPTSRWYIASRARALGQAEAIPADWNIPEPEALVAAVKQFTDDERVEMSKEGIAMPDGSYPIPDVAHIRAAVNDFNRTGADPEVKKHIVKRAVALDATSDLPADWVDPDHDGDNDLVAGKDTDHDDAEYRKKLGLAASAEEATTKQSLRERISTHQTDITRSELHQRVHGDGDTVTAAADTAKTDLHDRVFGVTASTAPDDGRAELRARVFGVTAGIIHDLGKAWDEALHPRDRDGKFIAAGSTVHVHDGVSGKGFEGTAIGVKRGPSGDMLIKVHATSDGTFGGGHGIIKGNDVQVPTREITAAPSAKGHLGAGATNRAEAMQASEHAFNLSAKAEQSGTTSDHYAASRAHQNAADMHREAGIVTSGHTASIHETLADEHINAANGTPTPTKPAVTTQIVHKGGPAIPLSSRLRNGKIEDAHTEQVKELYRHGDQQHHEMARAELNRRSESLPKSSDAQKQALKDRVNPLTGNPPRSDAGVTEAQNRAAAESRLAEKQALKDRMAGTDSKLSTLADARNQSKAAYSASNKATISGKIADHEQAALAHRQAAATARETGVGKSVAEAHDARAAKHEDKLQSVRNSNALGDARGPAEVAKAEKAIDAESQTKSAPTAHAAFQEASAHENAADKAPTFAGKAESLQKAAAARRVAATRAHAEGDLEAERIHNSTAVGHEAHAESFARGVDPYSGKSEAQIHVETGGAPGRPATGLGALTPAELNAMDAHARSTGPESTGLGALSPDALGRMKAARESTTGKPEGNLMPDHVNNEIRNVIQDRVQQKAAPAPGAAGGKQVGARVQSEFGHGVVTEHTDRSMTYKLDSGESLNVQKGTPGYDRVKPETDKPPVIKPNISQRSGSPDSAPYQGRGSEHPATIMNQGAPINPPTVPRTVTGEQATHEPTAPGAFAAHSERDLNAAVRSKQAGTPAGDAARAERSRRDAAKAAQPTVAPKLAASNAEIAAHYAKGTQVGNHPDIKVSAGRGGFTKNVNRRDNGHGLGTVIKHDNGAFTAHDESMTRIGGENKLYKTQHEAVGAVVQHHANLDQASHAGAESHAAATAKLPDAVKTSEKNHPLVNAKLDGHQQGDRVHLTDPAHPTTSHSFDRVPSGPHEGEWHGAYTNTYGNTGASQHPGRVTDPAMIAKLEAARTQGNLAHSAQRKASRDQYSQMTDAELKHMDSYYGPGPGRTKIRAEIARRAGKA